MDDKLLQPYNPKEVEDRIYQIWEKSGLFSPDKLPSSTIKDGVFSIVLPPPNVTGQLHIGHALMLAVQDIMVRFHRMKGFSTLWVPGTDHAAIATQTKVETLLIKNESKNRHDLGREEFLNRVNTYASESRDIIVRQVKKMGCSLDWEREAFTLDETRTKAVREAFKRMYDAKLIYRGSRIVNWDAKLQTTVSDDELVYKEETTPFYYLKYGPFTIGTARPETKFGDKYVVMHPNDKRYLEYKHGQELVVTWLGGEIKAVIIKDESIDMEFGTGVMTITPWHDLTDFEIAERHSLDKEQIIDLKGKLTSVTGEFAGIHIKKARPLVIAKLEEMGLVEKIDENYVHNIATSERSGEIIEPQILKQWFIDVNKKFTLPHSKIEGIPSGSETTLKEIMKKTIESKQIEIIPDRFSKTYFHWIDNLRDWCISRQIWYGHRIPVWYRSADANGKSNSISSDGTQIETYVGTKAPQGEGWIQDEDTLDTWFSSGLWTFSTLGWPDETLDMKKFHPTTVLETGYDILFFWVARMILMSGFLLGDVPFKTVYLHGLVRDEKNRKLSKSLGNTIDPLETIEKYGADALRMALIIGTGPGNDSKISDDKIKAYKHFANKVWNVSRFVLSNTLDFTDSPNTILLEKDRLAVDYFNSFVSEVTEDIEKFRFYLAGEKIYHYFWHTFADVLIEESKDKIFKGSTEEKVSSQKMLYHIFTNSIKIMHPFMPFLTEEIWSVINNKTDRRLLMIEPWPSLDLKQNEL